MPKASPIQTNFNAGEFSPLLYGRVDFDKYDSGLAVCKNYLPLVQGPITRRPGTRFVAEVKDSSKTVRLVPFEFSTLQAYIIEFGDQYCRFYRNNGQITSGGSPFEISTPYLEADLDRLTFAQSADVLYIAHEDYEPRKLSRTGHTSWTLEKAEFQDGPYLPVPTAGSASLEVSGSEGNVTVTATSTTGINDDTGFQSTDVGRMIRIKGDEWAWGEITAVTSTTQVSVSIKEGEFTTEGKQWSFQGDGSTTTYELVDMPAPATADEDYIVEVDGVFQHATEYNINLDGAGEPESIAFTTAPEAGVDVHVRTAPGVTGDMSTTEYRLGLWSESTGWPGFVLFFQNRLVWAGGYEPQRVDASATGDFTKYSPSDLDDTVAADNALNFTLASTRVNAIQWAAEDDKGLLLGTVGAVWVIRASNPSEALTPANANASQSSRRGCARVPVVSAGETTVFVQRGGRRVRELAYLFEIDGFRSPDLSLLSEHLFQSSVKWMDMQQTPQSIIWAVQDDGSLRALTYEREQDVVGWTPQEIGGFADANQTEPAKVRDVAIIPDPQGIYDEVWLLVERHIDGATKQYVEYMTRLWEDGDTVEDGVFLDSSLEYDGAETTTISGLDHLEGQTVNLLVNGANHPEKTVSGGSVELERSATKVQAGLKYNSDGGTLYINAGARDGTTQGKTKRIDRVILRVWNMLGLKTGDSLDNLDEVTFRETSDNLNAAPPLFTGDLDGFDGPEVSYGGDYTTKGQFFWRQDQPFPGTITGYMPQVVVNDDG